MRDIENKLDSQIQNSLNFTPEESANANNDISRLDRLVECSKAFQQLYHERATPTEEYEALEDSPSSNTTTVEEQKKHILQKLNEMSFKYIHIANNGFHESDSD